jgi:hypothetical protein
MASFELQWRSSTKKDLRKLSRQEVPRSSAVPCVGRGNHASGTDRAKQLFNLGGTP